MARDGEYVVAGHPDWPVSFVGDQAKPYLRWREPWFPDRVLETGCAKTEDEAVVVLQGQLEHHGLQDRAEFEGIDAPKPVVGAGMVGWVRVRIPLDDREIVPKMKAHGTTNIIVT